MQIFQQLRLHTSNEHGIFKNNVRQTLFLWEFAVIQTSQRTYI